MVIAMYVFRDRESCRERMCHIEVVIMLRLMSKSPCIKKKVQFHNEAITHVIFRLHTTHINLTYLGPTLSQVKQEWKFARRDQFLSFLFFIWQILGDFVTDSILWEETSVLKWINKLKSIKCFNTPSLPIVGKKCRNTTKWFFYVGIGLSCSLSEDSFLSSVGIQQFGSRTVEVNSFPIQPLLGLKIRSYTM